MREARTLPRRVLLAQEESELLGVSAGIRSTKQQVERNRFAVEEGMRRGGERQHLTVAAFALALAEPAG